MRLFLAIELPEPVRAHLADAQDRLRREHPGRRASWTRPENLHLTLKFLGDVEAARVPVLRDALARPPLPIPSGLHADHLDCLPPRGPLRVIAAGLGGDLLALRAIHAAIEDACEPLGFPREGRPFRPHVTLARVKPFGPKWKREGSGDVLAWPGPGFLPQSVVMMQSHLAPEGLRYNSLGRFALRRGGTSL